MLRRAEQYSSSHRNKISFENHIDTNKIETDCDIDIKEEILDSEDEEKFVIKTEKEDSSDESETDAYVTLLFDDFDSKKLAVKKEIEDTKYSASTSQTKLEEKYFKSDEKFLKYEEKILRDEKKLLVSHQNGFDEIQEEELIIKDEPIDIDDDNDIRDESFFLDFVDNDSNDVIDDEETETADENTDEIDVVSIDDDDFRPSWWNTLQQIYQSKPPPVKRIKTLLPRRQPYSCTCKTKPSIRTLRRRRLTGGHSNNCPFSKNRNPQGSVCPERRIHHINSERQRRVELRSSFQELRDLIPEVKDKLKVSKVLILSEASAYVQQLRDECEQHQKQVNELLLKQRGLLSRVTKLRRNKGLCAATKRR